MSIKNKFEGQKIVIVIVILIVIVIVMVLVIIVKLKRSNFFLMLVKFFLMLIKFLFDALSFFFDAYAKPHGRLQQLGLGFRSLLNRSLKDEHALLGSIQSPSFWKPAHNMVPDPLSGIWLPFSSGSSFR